MFGQKVASLYQDLYCRMTGALMLVGTTEA